MSEAVATSERELPYVRAITEGVREVLLEQDNSFVAGEDVAGAGSVYGYYAGILDEFGPERIYDTPISEEGIVGLGVGFPGRMHGRSGESDGQNALHVWRCRYPAADDAHNVRRRRKPCRTALAKSGSLDLPPSWLKSGSTHNAL